MPDYTCPRCHAPLTLRRGEHGVVYPCVACDGVAIALSVLKKRANPMTTRQLWSRIQSQPPAAPGGLALECPVCRRAMKQLLAAGVTHAIEIDVCEPCQFFWLDAGEVEGFGAAPPVRPASSPEVDQAGERLRRALREERATRGKDSSSRDSGWWDAIDIDIVDLLEGAVDLLD